MRNLIHRYKAAIRGSVKSFAILATGLVLVTPFSAVSTASAAPILTEYTDNNISSPANIVAGPDGALWFIQSSSNKIGRYSTTGAVTTYDVPSPPGRTYPAFQHGLTVGSDGALWFTEASYSVIGRITTAGVITQYTLPEPPPGTPYPPIYVPTSITAGSDGALWFTENNGNSIGRITTSGEISQYPLGPCNGGPTDITSGPDGALWFTNQCTQTIGRLTTSGALTNYPLAGGTNAVSITSGSDGALWFTVHDTYNGLNGTGGKIGRITTSGVITEYPLPTPGSGPLRITSGSDGALWFTESGPSNYNGTPAAGNKIGRITTAGVITEYVASATPNTYPYGITTGPDGNIWFSTNRFPRIGVLKLEPVADTVRPVISFTAPTSFAGPFATGPTVTVTASDSGSGLRSLAIHVYTSANQLLTTCGTATPAQLSAGTMSCDLSSLPNGTYYIKAGTFDNAGNNKTINSGNFVIGQ